MGTVRFEFPDDMQMALNLDPAEAEAELRLCAAMKLFELGRLSSSAAAKLAGMPRIAFLVRLADYGVRTFRETEEELTEDVRNA